MAILEFPITDMNISFTPNIYEYSRLLFTTILLAALSILLLSASPAFCQGTATEKTVSVYGAKIFYLEKGDPSAPTVILLHGLGSSVESWHFNIDELAHRNHVIALDQIGFGRSDKPALKYRVGTFVDFLDQFMQELKIGHASLVGSSLGGWVAALTAIKYPDRVDKVVLVDAAGLKISQAELAHIYSLNFSTRDETRTLLRSMFFNHTVFASDRMVDESLRQKVLATDGPTVNSVIESIRRGEDFLDGRLGRIKQPTLIIWGRQDGLLKLTYARRFAAGIRNSRLTVFDKCGHIPQVEQAAEFNKAVNEFLSQN